MAQKQTYSKPIEPVVTFTAGATTKQIATSAREVCHLKLTAVGGSAHVALYNNNINAADPNDLVWVLDSSLQTNDIEDFANPLLFSKGIYAVCEDGFAFNPQLCLSYVPSEV